jgi:hypothetical protein
MIKDVRSDTKFPGFFLFRENILHNSGKVLCIFSDSKYVDFTKTAKISRSINLPRKKYSQLRMRHEHI